MTSSFDASDGDVVSPFGNGDYSGSGSRLAFSLRTGFWQLVCTLPAQNW